jgi:hypothetical protein
VAGSAPAGSGVDEDDVAAVVVGEGRQRGLEGGRERRGEGEELVLDLAAGRLPAYLGLGWNTRHTPRACLDHRD